MLHKISDLCAKVDAMQTISKELYRLKYETPAPKDQTQIQANIESIQALAGDIFHDRSPYQKD
jgi:hypothetical protein|tara:strand:+ start:6634 stop:6822 length:189 start_codon:yes stop_codon:yes gene_type:complete